MILAIVITLLLGIPLVIFCYLWIYQHLVLGERFKRFTNVVPCNWLTGHLLAILKASPELEMHLAATKIAIDNPKAKLINCNFFWIPCLLINDVEIVKEIFKHPTLPKGVLYVSSGNTFGWGILVANGDIWKRHRMLYDPMFANVFLKRYVDNFNHHARKYIRHQRKVIDNPHIYPREMSKLTLDTICDTALAYELNAITEENDAVKAMNEMLDVVVQPHVLLGPKWLGDLATKNTKKTIHAILSSSITTMRRKIANNEPIDQNHGILLYNSLMAKDENGMPFADEEIMANMCNFMLAGHETTSNAITWFLYETGRRPEIIKRLQDEVKQLCGEKDRDPTYEELFELKYMNMCMKEVLRMYPAAAGFTREAVDDLVLDDRNIPNGTMLMICPYMIHHNPRYWPNPEHYDPERFSEEKIPVSGTYIPFNLGHRDCIGRNFFWMEARIFLVHMLREFTWSILPNQKIYPSTQGTIKPKYGILFQLHTRE